ncbi:MAG TPA: class I SAM-dependent methyltransferase [Planctomycetota bacterium]|nr:class I SAM-dependent methyltransferase [Planctomycetota bacterium]
MPPAKPQFEHWFDPKRLFAEGYPKGVTSALKVFPDLAFEIQRIIVGINPRRALEVGPGDRPVIGSVRGAFYLDVVPRFLAALEGKKVLGDAREVPFRPGSFDLVVASDLFTHIPPKERTLALEELLSLAPRILIFNPAEGTKEVLASPVPTADLVAMLEDEGLEVERRDFAARLPTGVYSMALLYGEKKKAGK